jgi:hypothetical protein
VYIREAHPSDGWQVPANETEAIIYLQPNTEEERALVAQSCQLGLDIGIPMLIDGMDNATEEAYSAWPDSLYVVGKDGVIAYKGDPGPGGFRPREMEQALADLLREG